MLANVMSWLTQHLRDNQNNPFRRNIESLFIILEIVTDHSTIRDYTVLIDNRAIDFAILTNVDIRQND